jgi:hypothetical protein
MNLTDLVEHLEAKIDRLKKENDRLKTDKERLDWLLKYITFRKWSGGYKNICIKSPALTELITKLIRAWEQIESDDPRDIIDKAMGGESE